MKILLLTLLICSIIIEARENPFFPPTVKDKQTKSLSSPVQETALVNKSESVDFEYIRIIVSKNKIYIETKDKLKNVFIADDPKVIILNFYRNVNFITKRRKFNIQPFYEVRLGAHKNYYSFVVELTEAHSYRVKDSTFGYNLTIGDKR